MLVLHALARSLPGSRDFHQGLLNGLPALLDRWQQLLPDAVVARLAGAGHWLHEEDPPRVIEEIARFLH